MRRYRIGIFGRGTATSDGGADVFLRALNSRYATLGANDAVEIVPVHWSAWSHRRRPLRYWAPCSTAGSSCACCMRGSRGLAKLCCKCTARRPP